MPKSIAPKETSFAYVFAMFAAHPSQLERPRPDYQLPLTRREHAHRRVSAQLAAHARHPSAKPHSVSVTFLVTGFEPFAEFESNSSWDAICSLRERWPASIATLRLPVDHVAAHVELRRVLHEQRPRVVLCMGLARSGFRIERRARRPRQLPHELGEDDLLGHWPWDEMSQSLAHAGVAAKDSWDAGQYVCESTYWSLLSFRASAGFPEFAAFLHVPPRTHEFPLERIAHAVAAVVERRWQSLDTIVPIDSASDWHKEP
ncbi:MAG: hypothetical protein ABW217_22340 [Polyangiaceae bacterium]